MNKFFVFLCFLILFFLVSLSFGKDINRMLSDFFNNIGKYLEKEFEKRKEITEKELEKIINVYRIYMDNPTANAELIKNYQLIKKGLQMAFDIPKSLEFKAKIARKEMR